MHHVLPTHFLGAILALGGCLQAAALAGEIPKDQERAFALQNTFGTYNAAPRKPDGRVDVQKLMAELQKVHANTYNWLIWHAPTDWEDLQAFLPLTRGKELRVWVTLVPPSESPPKTTRYSEPFRLDYERWGTEIARLANQYTNLVAWSLDDFSHNAAVLTPERLRQILNATREVNPRLAFVPCCYYRHLTPEYAAKYRGLFAGILFPYRNESVQMNLTDASQVVAEVREVKKRFGGAMPVFVDVYATKHSRLNDSTPDYVKQVMASARGAADGVLIYCHQYEETSPAKHQVIRQLFADWSRSAGQSKDRTGQ